jgi:hypothetical protein
VAAHAIRDTEEAKVTAYEKAVLVVLALSADVGHPGEREPSLILLARRRHGPRVYRGSPLVF